MKTITNNFIISVLFTALLLAALPVLAQEDLVDNETETLRCETLLAGDEGTPAQRNFCERWLERVENLTDKREEMQENMAERQANMEERRTEAEAAIQERREEFQEAQEERRAALSERVQVRITNLAANVSNRLDAAVTRMQNIIDRINTRIEKLNERGVNTSEAEAHMEDAQDAVDAALAQLADIDEVVAGAVGVEEPRKAWQNAKTTFLAIKENIKSAHASLRAAVAALKEAVKEAADGNGASSAVQADQAFEDEGDAEEAETDSE